MQPSLTKALHTLAPELFIWECDYIVYQAGWLQKGIVGAAQLGASGYLYETPEHPIYSRYWSLIWEGRLQEAIEYSAESGMDTISEAVGGWFTSCPQRRGYFTHWGEAFKYVATVLGLPVGDYPHSRPPQALLPQAAKDDIRAAYEKVGLAKQPVGV